MADQLIDNQSVKLVDAIKMVLPHASQGRFAVGYFFLSGFNAIVDDLKSLDKLYLLIGSVTNRETVEQIILGYRRLELIEEKLREQRFGTASRAMDDTVGAIRQQISELQPGDQEEKTIASLADLIASGKVEVRVYTRSILHAKAYIFDYRQPQPNSFGIGIIGSSNLTGPGLSTNTELNVQVDDNANVITSEGMHRDLCDWFGHLWDEAKPFSAELMQELNQSWAMALARPYDVYLKMLFELVRSRVEGDSSRVILPGDIPLAPYQKVAVMQGIRMIDQYGGAFAADVVGVGKTFIGAAIARFYYESERRRPLIICPHSLEAMWKKYNSDWHLNAEIVPMSKLQEPDGKHPGEIEELDKDASQDCRFVLIDESHNFRYSESQRYRVLNDYLGEGADRKVLLLTATPYNQSSWDLYNQIKLFHHEEITRIPIEPRNLRTYFNRVEDGERRLSDLLVHLLVRRTRWQLLRWYGYDSETNKPVNPHDFTPYVEGHHRAYLKFTDQYGNTEKKYFPDRSLETITYCIDDVYGQMHGQSLYEQIVKFLHRRKTTADLADDPATSEADPDALIYARYGLWNYVLPAKQTEQRYRQLVRAGKNLRGLIRTSLFKRLESSVDAFRKSINRQVTVHENFLKALNEGKIAAGERAADLLEIERKEKNREKKAAALKKFISGLEEADALRGFSYDISDFDVKRLKDDVKHDLKTFKTIRDLVDEKKIPPSKDAKLQEFIDRVTKLRKKGKLLVFTQYEDTVVYLKNNLPDSLKKCFGTATGETENLQAIVRRFAPKSNDAQLKEGEELDFLIATDVLSEGLNLQDCGQVMNYDLHWNPVRLIQRFGRVDRIGSEHEKIFAFNFLPEKAAEHELELKQKLRARIAEFNQILGLDSKVVEESEQVNPEAVYAIYEERSGKHLGRFESDEADLIGVSLSQAEEFFRELRDNDPKEYERIRNLRDGLRTARGTGQEKVLVMCRAGDFIRLFVRNLRGQPVDIDTLDALNLLKCEPTESSVALPDSLNSILTEVKLRMQDEADEIWKQKTTRSPLTAGQRYIIEQIDKLRHEKPFLDTDGGLARLVEATSKTRQRRFQRACDRLKKDKVIGEALLRRVRQLYYDCALHIEASSAQEEEIETRIPRIVAVAAL
jgi:superfamily II DNA or RNA helicase